MLATGAGSSPNATRRGIAVIDGGVVEPESEVLAAATTALDLGADINGSNQAGDTALHVAAGRGLNTVVQLLADRGAQLNAKNKRGLTPLAALMPNNAGPVVAEPPSLPLPLPTMMTIRPIVRRENRTFPRP
jgi:ankyrin repeat protein